MTGIAPLSRSRPATREELEKIPCVYRYFAEEWQAKALTQGGVFFSTLNRCREAEEAKGADPEEAREVYAQGVAWGNSESAEMRTILDRLGFVDLHGSNIKLGFNVSMRKIPDAFVICTSEDLSPALAARFGQFCVRLDKPVEFFRRLHRALVHRRAQHHRWYHHGWFDRVTYVPSNGYDDLEDSPGPLGFVKRMPFELEQEARFLFLPDPAPAGMRLEKFEIPVPGVARLCTQVVVP
jgi:hypothetical protein